MSGFRSNMTNKAPGLSSGTTKKSGPLASGTTKTNATRKKNMMTESTD